MLECPPSPAGQSAPAPLAPAIPLPGQLGRRRARLSQAEPGGPEDNGKNGEGRIVGREDETPESATHADARGGRGNVRSTHEEHPTPRAGLLDSSRWCTRPLRPPAARTGAGIRCLRDTRGLAPRHGPARRTSDPGRRPSPYTGPRPGRSGPGATHCRMVPTPALSKPRLPVPSRHLGCALTLQTECLRLQPRNPAASTTFSGYPSTLHQSDQ